jgi:3-oxoadipate enol-lactonase
VHIGEIRVGGLDISYARRGSGMPLVLIHGYPLDRSIWDPLSGLLEDDFDLIMPDLRGFGNSGMLDSGGSIAAYAADVAGLLEALQLSRVAVAGHSMGGYVALAMVRHHTSLIAGLSLVASQVRGDTRERQKGRYKAAIDVMEQGVGPVADAMSLQLTSIPEIQLSMRDLIQRQRPAALASALRAMAERPDARNMIASLQVPVVVIHGDADVLIPIDRGREVRNLLPAADLVEVHGAGHLPMLEQQQAVAEGLRLLLKARGP